MDLQANLVPGVHEPPVRKPSTLSFELSYRRSVNTDARNFRRTRRFDSGDECERIKQLKRPRPGRR